MFPSTRVKKVFYDDTKVELGCFRLTRQPQAPLIWCVSLETLEDVLEEKKAEVLEIYNRSRHAIPTTVMVYNDGRIRGRLLLAMKERIFCAPWMYGKNLCTSHEGDIFLTLEGLYLALKNIRDKTWNFVESVDWERVDVIVKVLLRKNKKRVKIILFLSFHPRTGKFSILARAKSRCSNHFEVRVLRMILKLAGIE